MIRTTVCYLFKDDYCLMMHRNKKKNDPNQGKFIGVGGKIQDGETPLACIKREVFEETGLILKALSYHGIVWFISDQHEHEEMHLFTSNHAEGTMHPSDEGDLLWVHQKEVLSLNLWEGDRIFHTLIQKKHPFFQLKLIYVGDHLKEAYLDGHPIDLKK